MVLNIRTVSIFPCEGPGCLNLRGSGEHTHFWREGDQTAGGHYHGDTSPEEVSDHSDMNITERIVSRSATRATSAWPLRWSGSGTQWSKKWRIEKSTQCNFCGLSYLLFDYLKLEINSV